MPSVESASALCGSGHEAWPAALDSRARWIEGRSLAFSQRWPSEGLSAGRLDTPHSPNNARSLQITHAYIEALSLGFHLQIAATNDEVESARMPTF